MKIELTTMELCYINDTMDKLREEWSLNAPFTKNAERIETGINVLHCILEKAHFLPSGKDIHASLMEANAPSTNVPNGHHDPTIEFADDY